MAVPDWALNRRTRELSGVLAGADGEGLCTAGGLMRVDGPAIFDSLEGWLRRACKRSNSELRDTLVLSETLGEGACGVDLVMLSVPIRLPRLLVPLRLPTSDGCGRELDRAFGEYRNVRGEDEFVLGAKLRGPGALGVKLGAGLLRIGLGAWLTRGLNEGREPIEGLEGIDGAGMGRLTDGLGWLKDGLGWLKDGLGRLNDGLGRLNDGLG